MYIGRIVAVAANMAGRNFAMYRVSSRSFPNRTAVPLAGNIAVVPRPGFESDLAKNPYITYNCVRTAGEYAVVSNGSHTDPIAEKIASGTPVRDAISLGLLALDYEHDSLSTPRIVAVVHCCKPTAFLGIIRRDALLVREITLRPGKAFYLSTYECDRPCDQNCDAGFDASDAASGAGYIVSGGVFSGFDLPVTSACAASDGGKFEFATLTV